MPIINPSASRTLDPTGRSFKGVVGIHDRNLSDADLNLIQSLQDSKTQRALADQVCSGVLSYSPFQFTARTIFPQSLQFGIPAFDVIMNGEIVTIGGQFSPTLSNNIVRVPAPISWAQGSTSPAASIYIVFIEFWYQQLNPANGIGFASANGLYYIYPNGCVNALPSTFISNDVIDPFQASYTTQRSQIQWAIRVQSMDLAYDFSEYAFGLDPGPTTTQSIYSQAGQVLPQSGSVYQFRNMGPVNGDSGLWRSGDGNPFNNLATLDGYSYALPVAVVFQRNTGVYAPQTNPLGTAFSLVAGSGTLASGVTGRFDGRYSDVVYPEDVVDTRAVVSLTGWNNPDLVDAGFADVISGKTRLALARGETPGNLPIVTGGMLDYLVSVAPTAISNTDTVGSFDGYRNGFSAADYTSYFCQTVTVEQKTIGTMGMEWSLGDSFTVTIPNSSQATIEYLNVQGLVNDSINNIQTPVLYLSGQITVTGLGTKIATVTFAKSLTGTSYDPGINPLYVTVGVEYAANGGLDLVMVPDVVWGGILSDAQSATTLPAFGVSSYEVQSPLPNGPMAFAYNPSFSKTIFGTRVKVLVQNGTTITGTPAMDATGNPITIFTLSTLSVGAGLNGIYVVSAIDQVSGLTYLIAKRNLLGTTFTLTIQGTVPTTSTLILTFMAANTAQMSYCAPVKAVTQIEETVLVGNSPDYPMDPRVSTVSLKFYTTYNSVVLATTNALLSSLSGDDTNKLIWVKNILGSYDAITVSNAVFANGFVTLTVPPTVNIQTQAFFLVAGILPAFNPASSLILSESYVPYQGEGIPNRNYEVVYSENEALVTTNGTGAAPVPGLQDVYPYNRELPIITTLPSQVSWLDSTLINQPVSSFFDSNYAAKKFDNIETTLAVPIHTNDFIQPFNSGIRKIFQLTTSSGGRGFAKLEPHLGFAIVPVTPKVALGKDLTATTGSITVYVDNVNGNDENDGQSLNTAFATVAVALASLPDVLYHPCSVQLVPNGQPYSMAALKSSLSVVALGDGTVRESKYYALGIISSPVQASGRLVITALAGSSQPVVIDATGYVDYGDGPTAAFFVNNTRVIFNGITFNAFAEPAVKGLAADVEFVDCIFTNNLIAGSFEQGSTVIMLNGTISLANGCLGFILASSVMEGSGVTFTVLPSASPGYFFTVERSSSLTLAAHSPSLENGVSPNTIVVRAQLNSSIVTTPDFTTSGQAALIQNSVLSRTVSVNPFIGGVVSDASSSISTTL